MGKKEIRGKIKYKKSIILFSVIGFLISGYIMLTLEVSIRQGVNGVVSARKMPLYMKVMDFLTRSNHYKLLVEDITKNCKTDEEILKALFKWTSSNIRTVPEGFPIVDDHVDSIIIRGYGTNDQSADVFTTLAAFCGFKGGIYSIKIYPEGYIHNISVIEKDEDFLLFDTYSKFFFYNGSNKIATLNEITKDINLVKNVTKDFKLYGKYFYYRFFEHLKPVDKIGWSKADLQVPSKRLLYIGGRFIGVSDESHTFYGENYK